MLESIHVESYRTLRNTSVTFRDGLNIIIGQNGVGKSNLLRFISTYAKVPSFMQPVNRRMRILRGGYSYVLSGVHDGRTDSCEVKVTRVKANVPDEDDVDYEVQITLIANGDVVENSSDVLTIDRKKRLKYRADI